MEVIWDNGNFTMSMGLMKIDFVWNIILIKLDLFKYTLMKMICLNIL